MSSRVLNPRVSGELIVKFAKYVQVKEDGVKRAAKKLYDELVAGKIVPQRFSGTELHPKEANEDSLNWIFLIDTLNFSFWSQSETTGWKVKFHDKNYSGYFALCAGVNRAIEEGINLTDPRVYGSLTEGDILRIFRSETSESIPMIGQRIENLREASEVLLEKYDGSFVNCVKECGQSAEKLLNQIVRDFPSYRDQGIYEGNEVSFWKRAQILVGDIWAMFEGKDLGYFSDIECLAMFPDYRIPQVLLHFGVLEYTPKLLERLNEDELLTNGSREEMEIRGASVHAVELIKEGVRNIIAENIGTQLKPESINSIMIDHYLWDYRREHVTQMDAYPFHKVRCIYY